MTHGNLARAWAARIRTGALGASLATRLEAEIQAKTLETFAGVLDEAPEGRPDELTPAMGTEIPPGAAPPKPVLP